MKIGRQEPTFSVIGKYAYSMGAEVVAMFEEEGGGSFYEAQKMEMELLLARDRNGEPSAMTIGIAKPRQNGKSYSARYYSIYMAEFEHRQVLYSAHHSTTTNKMFKAFCNLFENPERYPNFANDVKSISHARGYEGIYFKDWRDSSGNYHDGGCIEFATRTNNGSRGGTYSVIVIDEAQMLTADQQEGMLPVISAASSVYDHQDMPQQIFIGTPPGPMCTGTVFRDMHRTAHSEEKGAVWWLEWAVESENIEETITSAAVALDLAYETNPAMGIRIAEKTVMNEFETMTIEGFARERIGWWAPEPKESTQLDLAIDYAKWIECASQEAAPSGKTAYGVKFSADGSEVCLCVAVIGADNTARIEMIDRKPTGLGIQWLASWLEERYKVASCVVIDGKNNVDLLIDKIRPIWLFKDSVIRPSAQQVIAAASMLINEINENSVSWFRLQEGLDHSAQTTVKRPIGRGGYGFGGEDPAPIEAAALALYGARTSKRNPQKKMRIG